MKKKVVLFFVISVIFIFFCVFIKNIFNDKTMNKFRIEHDKKNIDNTIVNSIKENNLYFNIIEKYIPENINNNKNKTDDNSLVNDHKPNYTPNNVTIEVCEDSITNYSINLLIIDKNEDKYSWIPYYIIQKKDNDNWNNLELIKEMRAIEMSLGLDENGTLLQRINWSKYYGELSSGIYRIVKPIYDLNIGEYINFSSNEFIIK